jgi:predicted SprT family Zn-dependent metalloprotease
MNLIEAEILARELIEKHCPNVRFKWANGKNKFGACYAKQKIISLSTTLTMLNNPEVVKNVILHEIAHVIAPITAHHNWEWRKIAVSIGCDGKRLYDDSVITPKPKWLGTCPKCKRTIKRFSRRKISCGKCSVIFNKDLLFIWERLTD